MKRIERAELLGQDFDAATMETAAASRTSNRQKLIGHLALASNEFEGPRCQRVVYIKELMAKGIISADLRHRTEPKQLAG